MLQKHWQCEMKQIMNAEVTSLHLAPLDGADGQVMLVQAIVVHINIKLKCCC